ncbi:MAG: hypothetical protein QME64_11900, partial [bacterium]|nr:hypothetical protein [bacterium]
ILGIILFVCAVLYSVYAITYGYIKDYVEPSWFLLLWLIVLLGLPGLSLIFLGVGLRFREKKQAITNPNPRE